MLGPLRPCTFMVINNAQSGFVFCIAIYLESPAPLHQPKLYGQILLPTRPHHSPPGAIVHSKADRVIDTQFQTIGEANEHAIYLARAHIGGNVSAREVLVKFTAKYNEAARCLLAVQDSPLASILSTLRR